MDSNLELIVMNLIVQSGSARSSAMEAIYAAKKGNFGEAASLLEDASTAIGDAHKAQTGLLQKEAAGEKVQVELLLVHAQDHLMCSNVVLDLARELVDVYQAMQGGK